MLDKGAVYSPQKSDFVPYIRDSSAVLGMK